MSSRPTVLATAALLCAGTILGAAGPAAAAGPISLVSEASPGPSEAQNLPLKSRTNTAMAQLRGELYFFGTNPAGGAELWRTDGTASGTRRSAFFPDKGAGQIVATDEALFFPARDASATSLYRSDGTAAGTTLVHTVGPEGTGYTSFSPAGNRLVFEAVEEQRSGDGPGGSSRTMLGTDGTPEGTVQLAKYSLMRHTGFDVAYTRADGLVYFRSSRYGFVGQTDGTVAGTTEVERASLTGGVDGVHTGAARDGSRYAVTVARGEFANHHVLVRATAPGEPAQQLAQLPGTAFTDYHVPPFDGIVQFGDSVVFMAPYGRGVWISDGTPAGTRMLATSFDPRPTPSGELSPQVGPVSELTVVGDRIYFVASDAEHGRELWSSDGTPAGTTIVEELRPGAASTDPASLSVISKRLVFAAAGADGVRRLYGIDVDPSASGPRRATATPTVIAPTPTPAAKLVPQKLTVGVAKRSDRRAPFRWSIGGTLSLPTGAPTSACSGTVTVTVQRGRRTVATETAPLQSKRTQAPKPSPKTTRTAKTICTYRVTVGVSRSKLARRGGELTAHTSFGGNSNLAAARSTRGAKLRYGAATKITI